MALITASFEGQTNATAVTAANSDDFGDAAVSNVVLNSGTINYSSTQAAHGSLSMQMAAAAGQTYLNYNFGSAGTSFRARFYMYWTAYSSAEAQGPADIRNSANTGVCRLQTTTAGRIKIMNSAGTQVAITTNVIPLNTWIRVEYQGSALNGSAGVLALQYFTGDSTTPTESISASAVVTNSTVQQLILGRPSSANANTFYFDDIAFEIGSSTPIGPYVVPAVTADATAPLTWGATADAFLTKTADSTAPLTIASSADATTTKPVDGSTTLTLGTTAAASVTRFIAGTAPLSFSTASTASLSKALSGSSSLLFGATATVTTSKTLDGTASLTLAQTATATRTAVFNSAAVLALSTSATIATQGSANATAPLLLTTSAAATVTRVVGGTAPLVIGGSASAFGSRPITGSLGLTFGTSATLDIAGQTTALAPLSTVFSATASVSRTIQGSAPLILTCTASASAARSIQGTAPLSLTSLATATAAHPADSSAALALSATASMTVLNPATVGGSADLLLNTTGVLSKSSTMAGSAGLSIASTATAYGTRPATSTAVTTVVVTASATVEKGIAATSVTSIVAGGTASLLKPSTGLPANLVMTTVASLATVLRNGGQTDLSLNASGTATVTHASPVDLGDEFLLEMQRQLTHDYIMENPSTIILRPRERERSSTGGFIMVAQATRATQIMRIIESATYSEGGVARTETGFQRKRNYQLMGEWDAIIEVDDQFTYDDAEWVVRSFMPNDGYQTRAVVERIGA